MSPAAATDSAIRTVGFQGELGAFSEEAVGRLCPEARPVPRRTFVDVVRAVESAEDDAGLLPVENTLAGGVAAAYDALAGGRVGVRAEVVIPIRHFLLGAPGATLEGVREVASHPVALSQCARFFAAHPGLEPVSVYDTAGAAMEVAERGDWSRAAVASRRAAERFGLTVLAEDIQDRPDNQTRFYLVTPGEGLGEVEPSRFKTSLIAETENRPGSLHELLGVFARRSLDLTYIESRPGETPWTYRFVLEYVHAAAEETRAALDELSDHTTAVRLLGVFPAWAPDHSSNPHPREG